MRDRRWTWWLAAIGTVAVLVAVGSLLVRGRPLEVLYARWILHNSPIALLTIWLGHLALMRSARHLGGLVLVWIGAWSCLHVAAISLADAQLAIAGLDGVELIVVPAELPLRAAVPLWISTWAWIPPVTTFLTLLFLYCPNGELPGLRWRWVPPVAALGTALLVMAYMVESWPSATYEIVIGGQVSARPLALRLLALGGAVIVVAAVASVASLAVRWRRAQATERRQLRPVVLTGGLGVAVFIGTWPWQWVWIPASLAAMWAFVLAYGVAVTRYRLHDVDLVVNRAVVAAILAALTTAGYLGVVVTVGALVGRGTEHAVVPLLAAGMVAVLFAPTRRRVRRLVDRMLYGRDRDAYEVLAELSHQLRATSSSDEILQSIAGLLLGSTGADRAEVALLVGEVEWVAAASGSARDAAVVRDVPVVHDGEVLGRLRLRTRAATNLAPDAEALLGDVAGTLGVILRNTHLTVELRAQVEELRRSRARLVEVHDEARRALERDLHDGAQARLIALRIRLGLAAEQAQREGAPATGEALGGLARDLDEAVRSLRALARGLHPPSLTGGGIVAALRTEGRALPVPVDVEEQGVGRYAPAVEAAVYFTCLEAVQNAVQHGAARTVRVVLSGDRGGLAFRIVDDGLGFDPRHAAGGRGLANVRDRIEALGGTVEVRSVPGEGATVSARLPAQPLVAER